MVTTDSMLKLLEGTSLAGAVRGDSGWDWLFPIVETLHVAAVATVFGSIAMMDLRLLGVSSRGSTVSRVAAECLPITWIAFAFAVLAGSVMFISKARIYFHNPQFELKFLCMALAGINMAVFHAGVYRHVRDWDSRLPPPRAARVAGALSIALWIGVIFFGRWTGFTT